jgi:hypothetical protein
MKHSLFAKVGAPLAVVGVIAACGTSADRREFATGNLPIAPIADFGDAGECHSGLTCSPDLHQVVSCDGKSVVATCPPDQGCARGACVPACNATEINKSTIGCDYYSVNPDVLASARGACYAVFVANTWSAPVTIAVERDGAKLDVSSFARIPSGSGKSVSYAPLVNGQLPPGEVAILFLAHFGPKGPSKPNCPAGIEPGVTTEDAALHGTGIGKSFHITTSAPVVAYDIYPFGGGPSMVTSATLLLPITAYDTNYVAVAPYRNTSNSTKPDFHSWLQIVAREDDTSVTISPTRPIEGGSGIAPTAKGEPATYTLSKGQVLQLTQADELSGSPIQSTKPIGVVGGNRCMNMPDGSHHCDAGHQMIPPVRALGNEYVGVRYRNRNPDVDEAPPWRIVGAVDGTTLVYEPAMPTGAPTAIQSGEVAEFRAAGPFVVRSQDGDHPFYMSAHMTGCSEVSGGVIGCPGDPESVNVIPPAQFLTSYAFFTDPTYPETNLVFVRKKGPDGFQDVTLDCAGKLSGWQPADSAGTYEYTRVDLVRGNFEPQGTCDNGRHEAFSKAPFGVTVWAWGTLATGAEWNEPPGFNTQFVSYAYPAGASVQPITDVVVPVIK